LRVRTMVANEMVNPGENNLHGIDEC
jgi:hypothetical protein